MEQDKISRLAQPLKLALFFGVLVAIGWFIFSIKGVLSPFVVAFVLAYVLAPLVDRIEGRGIHRSLSILTVFFGFIGILVLGGVVAGRQLNLKDLKPLEEIEKLKDDFLLEESVSRSFSIFNVGSDSVLVRQVWMERIGNSDENTGPGFPFSVKKAMLLPARVPKPFSIIRIPPGDTLRMDIVFAPKEVDESTVAKLVISYSNMKDPFPLWVQGNVTQVGNEAGNTSQSTRVGDLVFSAQALDFGSAGPNVVTAIRKVVDWMENKIQKYLGEDFRIEAFDLFSGVSPVEWLTEQGQNLVKTLLGSTTDLIGGLFSGLTFLVIVPFVAFFFLLEGRRFTHGVIDLVPNAYFELCLNLLYQINQQIGGYIRGQLLATTVVGGLAVMGLFIIDMPYYLPLGILAGLANMIPFLGPMIGIISASIVALTLGEGFSMVWLVIGVFLLIQITDNILIQPTIVAKSVKMHPLVVLLAVMVGSQWIGIVGMLIAVPVTAILKVIGQTIYWGIKEYRPL